MAKLSPAAATCTVSNPNQIVESNRIVRYRVPDVVQSSRVKVRVFSTTTSPLSSVRRRPCLVLVEIPSKPNAIPSYRGPSVGAQILLLCVCTSTLPASGTAESLEMIRSQPQWNARVPLPRQSGRSRTSRTYEHSARFPWPHSESTQATGILAHTSILWSSHSRSATDLRLFPINGSFFPLLFFLPSVLSSQSNNGQSQAPDQWRTSIGWSRMSPMELLLSLGGGLKGASRAHPHVRPEVVPLTATA